MEDKNGSQGMNWLKIARNCVAIFLVLWLGMSAYEISIFDTQTYPKYVDRIVSDKSDQMKAIGHTISGVCVVERITRHAIPIIKDAQTLSNSFKSFFDDAKGAIVALANDDYVDFLRIASGMDYSAAADAIENAWDMKFVMYDNYQTAKTEINTLRKYFNSFPSYDQKSRDVQNAGLALINNIDNNFLYYVAFGDDTGEIKNLSERLITNFYIWTEELKNDFSDENVALQLRYYFLLDIRSFTIDSYLKIYQLDLNKIEVAIWLIMDVENPGNLRDFLFKLFDDPQIDAALQQSGSYHAARTNPKSCLNDQPVFGSVVISTVDAGINIETLIEMMKPHQ